MLQPRIKQVIARLGYNNTILHNNEIMSANKLAEDATTRGPFALGDFAIDEYRPIRVAVIGAGISGIVAGVRFPQKVPNVQLTIYEKDDGVGGTWYRNRYPGLACDIPAHCYQLTFEEKKDWSALYAPGTEIREYLQGIVDKYELMRFIKLRHEVVGAQYAEDTGKWHLRVRRTDAETGATSEFENVVDVLIPAIGVLSRWDWPDIEGLHDFKGELHHTAGFDPQEKSWQEVAEDWKDKKVAVIGVGSSAIQLVPAIQPKVQRLYNYVRGKTWLAVPFASDTFATLLGRAPEDAEDYHFSAEEIERFKTDEAFYRRFRAVMENDMNSMHAATLRGSDLQKEATELFKANMRRKLAKKPWIADCLMPTFPVACRRLTPGPGYLEALVEDNVEFITSPIKRITERGIETIDGQHTELDMIFCATGYDTSFQLPFEIVGRDGMRLNDRWQPHPTTYLTMCVDGFPNMFMVLGPNSGIGSGSMLIMIEYEVMYAVQAVLKMQRERLKSIEVQREALLDFDDYLESYFPKTVYSEKCRSWYKMGAEDGRVVGLWPGSALAAAKAIMHPRWEDFKYELIDPSKNRFFWFGDGQTYNEKTMSGDRAWYLGEDTANWNM
ncbi:FAD/NAD-P-binding domain-containing protein [Lentinus tigrinus ALCF2SS1-7]|uniref:FAD/NAD-P-binding domain-containing protein n=1 Tax=Lentinus tigrinus ALCF2SS1-7 TaxID=1328758 RepID=UPI001165F14F|nr:FAD/NAD-P-binding domain-containing protein [Lentinus tigrinus ALCF2SS1-7]